MPLVGAKVGDKAMAETGAAEVGKAGPAERKVLSIRLAR